MENVDWKPHTQSHKIKPCFTSSEWYKSNLFIILRCRNPVRDDNPESISLHSPRHFTGGSTTKKSDRELLYRTNEDTMFNPAHTPGKDVQVSWGQWPAAEESSLCDIMDQFHGSAYRRILHNDHLSPRAWQAPNICASCVSDEYLATWGTLVRPNIPR